MIAAMTTSIYSNLIKVAEEYLGPAGKRFVDRQIEFHLHKKPQDISKQDLGSIKEWFRVSMALLTNDQKIVQDFESDISNLMK